MADGDIGRDHTGRQDERKPIVIRCPHLLWNDLRELRPSLKRRSPLELKFYSSAIRLTISLISVFIVGAAVTMTIPSEGCPYTMTALSGDSKMAGSASR